MRADVRAWANDRAAQIAQARATLSMAIADLEHASGGAWNDRQVLGDLAARLSPRTTLKRVLLSLREADWQLGNQELRMQQIIDGADPESGN